jgi:hypothetical protein
VVAGTAPTDTLTSSPEWPSHRPFLKKINARTGWIWPELNVIPYFYPAAICEVKGLLNSRMAAQEVLTL